MRFRQGVTIKTHPNRSKTYYIAASYENIQLGRRIIITPDQRTNFQQNTLECGVTKYKDGRTMAGYFTQENQSIGCLKVSVCTFIGKCMNAEYTHGLFLISKDEWYSGSFKGKYPLAGTMSANNSLYSGWFFGNEFEGYGQLLQIDETVKQKVRFKGWFHAGQPTGKGQVLQVRGQQICCGGWKNYKQDGDATVFTDSYYYIGSFVQAKAHGKGTEIYIFPLDSELLGFSRYEGIFSNGFRSQGGECSLLFRTILGNPTTNIANLSCILLQRCGTFTQDQVHSSTQHLYHCQNPYSTLAERQAICFSQLKLRNFKFYFSRQYLFQYGFQTIHLHSQLYGEILNERPQKNSILIQQCNKLMDVFFFKEINLKTYLPVKENLNGNQYCGNVRTKLIQNNEPITIETTYSFGIIEYMVSKNNINGSVTKASVKNNSQNGQCMNTDLHGNSFKGNRLNGKKHGFGILKGLGLHYEGYFENNLYSGYGVLTVDSAVQGLLTYKGTFVRGCFQWQGQGIFIDEKSKYLGQFQFDAVHGQGIKLLKTGEFFQGEFINGLLVNGIHQVNSQLRYQGTLKNRKYHGKGRLECNDFYYLGDFYNDEQHGKGIEVRSISKYFGDFEHNLRHGRGQIYYNNGDVYDGELDNDVLQGNGNMITKDYTFSGQFINGQASVYGKTITTSGIVYTGEHLDGLPHGKGTFVYQGNECQGRFVNGCLHGYGTIKNLETGVLYSGEFFEFNLPYGVAEGNNFRYVGQLQKLEFHGKGQLFSWNGDVYDGEWVLGQLQGQVIVSTMQGNGSVYAGNWLNNRPHGCGVLQWKVKGHNYLTQLFQGNIKAQTICIDETSYRIVTKTELAKEVNKTQEIQYAYDGIWQNGQYNYGKLYVQGKCCYEGYFIDNHVQKQNPNEIQQLESGALSMIQVRSQNELLNGFQQSISSKPPDTEGNFRQFQKPNYTAASWRFRPCPIEYDPQ